MEFLQNLLRQELTKLQNLDEEGKVRNDDPVKVIEDNIRIALTVPKECWFPASHSLKGLIKNIYELLDTLQSLPLSPKIISDEHVLKNASGGLALEGIYKTSILEDLLVKREQLIELPDAFSINGLTQGVMYEQKEFSSQKSQSLYQEVIEKLGRSLGSLLKAGSQGIGFGSTEEELRLCETKKEKSSQPYEQTGIFNTKYNYIPLASTFIEKDQLKLSSGAIHALQDIEAVIVHDKDSNILTSRICKFYDRFGSHVNQGPIHFGGIFWWRASAAVLSGDDLSDITNLTSEALNNFVGAGYNGLPQKLPTTGNASSSQLKGSSSGRSNEVLMSQVELSVSTTGGPAELDNHFQWKSHLVTSNRTWSVIDRGTTLIPIWEILITAHKSDFKDALNLSRILMEEFTQITKVNVENELEDHYEVNRAKIEINSAMKWSASECEPHLKALQKLKSRLHKKTGSHEIWIHICLSNQEVQNYLLDVARVNTSSPAVRALMDSLLNPHVFFVKTFPDLKRIMAWINETQEDANNAVSVSTFSELTNILELAKEELLHCSDTYSSAEKTDSAKIQATQTVTSALNSLCKTWSENDQVEAELLVLSIINVLGYSRKYSKFNHHLDCKEIDWLQTKLQNAFRQYSSLKEHCATRAQAYLLQTALTTSTVEDMKASSKEKRERLQFIKSQLQDKLSIAIISALENSDGDWQLLESALKSIITGMQVKDISTKPQDIVYQQDNLPLKQVPLLFHDKGTDDENTAENKTACKKGDCFMNLLQKLGLRDSYPKMMTQENVLLVDIVSLSVSQPSMEKELSSHYLYKLMMLDYRARYMFIKQDKHSLDSEQDGATVDNDDFFDFEDKTHLNVNSKQAHIHPMDVHMAVFHCANDFLRPYIFRKLSTCQFAIPFLVPDPCTEEVEFPFWVLRHISKSWQSKTNSTADKPGKYKSRKISSTPVPVVSFVRLGMSNSNSKSEILNGIISKQRHSVFFNRHCKGSTPDSLLMKGVVEIAWYCPGGKEDDIFDDCVAFLNLRGNAAEHPKQLEFIQAVSTVNVLLLSEHLVSEAEKRISQKLSTSTVPLICVFSGKEHIQQSKNPTKLRLAAKNRNHAELTEELISSIKQCIGENKQTKSIDMCYQVAVQQQFKVNDIQKAYQEGYELAQTLISLLAKENPSTLKEKLLPLQGELWHEWCKKNKEQFRLQFKERESIEQQLSEITATKDIIRHRQKCKATPLNEFVRSFLECLTTPSNSKDTKLSMMQWLAVFLEDLTTDVFAELEEDYHSTWRKMREIPVNTVKASHVSEMQSKLNSISDKMAATTIGLQHLMREVGQLYETIQTTTKAGIRTSESARTKLPKIGADMLIYGCPLELMDGDAAHVPLTWIEAVIGELVKALGDKKLFVLSILGLQSSGKSTLLNTMFGVQFSVSVGRCTRGAFMQLIPVDSSIRNKLGYDFILIVDTEGLRSPELSTKLSVSHDNELATFIIGIGDLTVINIMGENPAEMHDILQICVQAFLRMKLVKIAPSCIFVHQNVADASAGEKAMEGRRRLQQKLDDMATIAARDENIEGINGFSDVIQFDIETQVFYFKNLLEGDPPMAPPNPSYSQNVQELKTKLLTIAEWNTECKFSSFSEFKLRVHDLWTALLQENFVFSFRNTIEMMVYSYLEEKYAAWSWKLREHALEIQTKLCNQIGSDLIKEVNVVDLTENFDKVYNPLQCEIEKYFKEDRNKEILVMWRVNIDKRFMNLKNELIDEARKKCKEQFTSKKNRSALDQKKTEYTAELTKQSKNLASNLKKQRLDEREITKEFDILWEHWTAEVAKCHIPTENVDVKAIVCRILQKQFEKQKNINEKIKRENGKFELNKKKHVSQGFIEKVRTLMTDFDEIIQQMSHPVQKYVTEKENNKEDFNDSFIYGILATIEKTIAEFEKSSNNLIRFTYEFKVDLSIHLCLKYVSRFQTMQKAFKRANHPLTYLESQRENYFQAFRNYCKGANSVTIFVDFLCEHIKPKVLAAVNDKTTQHIAGEMKHKNPAFNSNRSNLENHILKHLATEEDFSSFQEYIDFPKRYFERFIQEKVDDFCRDTTKLHLINQENLGTLKNEIFTASRAATTGVEDKKGDASMWLDGFCEAAGEHMVINRNELRDIENEVIEDWQFLKDMMAKVLDEMLNDKMAIDVGTLREKPTKYLFQQLQGCWAQCPFCKAICTNTIPDHHEEHMVQFHRCDALAGWHFIGTDIFSINFCTTAVSSDGKFIPNHDNDKAVPYKKYREAGKPYSRWNITPDGSVQHYWKWFICQFQKQLQDKYKYQFVGKGEIPVEWKKITKQSALEQLK